MAGEVKIKGEGRIVYVHDGTAYRPIACLTSNSLNITRGVIEAQTKCDPGETSREAGSRSYELPLEGLYIDTTSSGAAVTSASHDYLLDIIQTEAGSVNWRLDSGLTDNPFYYGDAILTDLGADFAAGDEFATFSATLSGNGAIVKIDPIP